MFVDGRTPSRLDEEAAVGGTALWAAPLYLNVLGVRCKWSVQLCGARFLEILKGYSIIPTCYGLGKGGSKSSAEHSRLIC